MIACSFWRYFCQEDLSPRTPWNYVIEPFPLQRQTGTKSKHTFIPPGSVPTSFGAGHIKNTAIMPMPGYVFRDGGPVPDSELKDPQHQLNHQPGATPVMETKETATTTSPSNSVASTMVTPTSSASASNAPSESHALAAGEHEEVGHVQKGHEEGEVRDMGWNDHPKDVPQPLVGGLPNEELWTLVRRFNKQMYHVKATNAPLLGGLDLNIVDEDEFSPDKLRSNLERLYMTVIIGLMGFGKQIARLRSWREPRRTAGFCAVSQTLVQLKHLPLIIFTGVLHCMDLQPCPTSHPCHLYRSDRIPTIPSIPVPSCTSRVG